jgi:hypothetical protein
MPFRLLLRRARRVKRICIYFIQPSLALGNLSGRLRYLELGEGRIGADESISVAGGGYFSSVAG